MVQRDDDAQQGARGGRIAAAAPTPLSRRRYTTHCYWWELVECAKKLLLTGLPTFVFDDEVAQAVSALLVALGAALMLHLFSPCVSRARALLPKPTVRRAFAPTAP